jgi:hypothetical protein
MSVLSLPMARIQNWKKAQFFKFRYLIHIAHLGKIPRFCKILDLNTTQLKKIFD